MDSFNGLTGGIITLSIDERSIDLIGIPDGMGGGTDTDEVGGGGDGGAGVEIVRHVCFIVSCGFLCEIRFDLFSAPMNDGAVC